jgi:deoxyribose-phosphate aldolase
MNKFDTIFSQYILELNEQTIKKEVEKIVSSSFNNNNNASVIKTCLELIDLTSLNSNDTDADIISMVEKVNSFTDNYPLYPNVGAICVYPSMVSIVKDVLTENVEIASVAAGFPSSQTFIEVKVAEVAMAKMEGASEIDVVISIGKFLEKKYQDVYEELSELKAACGDVHLKVILETGLLPTLSDIKRASILAMASGADFIKTSTGKTAVSATPEATYVMCQAIKEWHQKTGQKIGFKAAGGIVTTADAVTYYTIVKEVLGEEWLNSKLFRFGASRLANNLLSSLEGKEVKYF